MIENKNKQIIYYTIPIIILVLICSVIEISYQNIYSRETLNWLAQCVGQDLSNIFFVVPTLLISAILVQKGSNIAKTIWFGAMITNIYSYAIYAFAVRFNILFHIYCIILGLSIYSVIHFAILNINEDFKSWFGNKLPIKRIRNFLIIITSIFLLLWLSNSLPYIFKNEIPKDIIEAGLITNPIHVLDFSFYLPLMYISAFMLSRKNNLGYFLVPSTIVFALITNLNIISLMVINLLKDISNTIPQICIFSVLALICIYFMSIIIKNQKV